MGAALDKGQSGEAQFFVTRAKAGVTDLLASNLFTSLHPHIAPDRLVKFMQVCEQSTDDRVAGLPRGCSNGWKP